MKRTRQFRLAADRFVAQSMVSISEYIMKTVTRFGAVASFLFCFAAGVCVLLIPGSSGPSAAGYLAAAGGFLFIGMGTFFGSMLWLRGEKHSPEGDRR